MDLMPRLRARWLVLAALGAGLACVSPPTKGDLNNTQLVNDMAETVNELRVVNSELRTSLDSLALVVARQDTLLRQVANAAGVQVPPR